MSSYFSLSAQCSAVCSALCVNSVSFADGIALMKIQGYSTREIAVYLDITEKAVYRRMDRLKEKLKKFFE